MKKLVLAVTMLGFSFGANAACDTKSLKGSYSVGVVSSNQYGSCALVGSVTFDGKGSLTITYNEGCGGQIVNYTAQGTYSINELCMGNSIMTSGTTAYFSFDKAFKTGQFFISQNGTIAFGSILKK
jgi:hypothetical protein